jgi:hypothetical protein
MRSQLWPVPTPPLVVPDALVPLVPELPMVPDVEVDRPVVPDVVVVALSVSASSARSLHAAANTAASQIPRMRSA